MTEVISHAERVRRCYKLCCWLVKENWNKNDIMPSHDRILEGHHVPITGQAGIGNTQTLKSVFQDLKFIEKNVALLCTTGMGCLQHIDIGATTVHRYLWMSKQLVLVRNEFEKNKGVDPVTAVKLVAAAEEKCKALRHDVPFQYPHSAGGSAYNRVAYRPDSVLDFWHPLEKAQYPEYFARRDVRKREYLERWEKKYGKVDDLN